MALSIKDRQADELAREIASRTGETLTEAVTVALRERLKRLSSRLPGRSLADELDVIACHCASLPVRDGRTPEQILGYDGRGLPR